MLKIRLARVGKKKQPTYRVVIADARAPRDGKYVEIIGQYNPRTEPNTFVIDEDKARDWMRKGAQPTERVHKLFATVGLMEAPVYPAPKPKEEPQASRGAAAAPTAAAPAAAAPAAAASAEETEAEATEAEAPTAKAEAEPAEAEAEKAAEAQEATAEEAKSEEA